ncbi:MAG: type II secretion system F family protein [Bacilli bacterium]
METILKPFIFIYHILIKLITLPKNLIKKSSKDEIKNTKVDNGVLALEKTEEKNLDEILITFKYIVKNKQGKEIKGVFDAKNIGEAKNFLVGEGYQVLTIVPRGSLEIELTSPKLSKAEISFMLTQLATYLRAGIPLIDAIRILSKQSVKPEKRKIYDKIVFELLTGQGFSRALEKQSKIFPKLLINMVKTAEMTGDLPTTLDEMSEYYKSAEETRKQMVSAMIYPSVIFFVSICVVAFVLIFVVPNFVGMYEQNNAELPGITIFVINLSNFLKFNYLYIIIALLVILFVYMGLFKNIKSFRKFMQAVYMKTPVIGNIIIYNEVTMLTKTFASLLNHSVFITNSMEMLLKLSDNEIYKDIISKTLINLGKGGKISESFEGEWAFPIVAYEMLVTGENTGQLGVMMEYVSNYYQSLHKEAVTRIKSLIEPIMIAFLAVTVGGIILSIIIPMFGIYSQI